MPSRFHLSIRLLHGAFHGKREGGGPEWPPSPLRVFQSLVAAAAARATPISPKDYAGRALEWLESLPAPIITAPAIHPGLAIRIAVPNNDLDLVALAWAKGQQPTKGPSELKTMKTLRPMRLLGGETLHYLWPLAEPPGDEVHNFIRILSEVSGSIVAVGLGIDVAIGHGTIISEDQDEALAGERWLPGNSGTGDGLRVPVPGTLDALIERHRRFLDRLGANGAAFTSPPPLSTYSRVEYHRSTTPLRLPFAAFSLQRLDGRGFQAFDAVRRSLTVAGMMRHATKAAAVKAGWLQGKINSFVLGHGESKGSPGHTAVGPRRFAFLPLPSIEPRAEGEVAVVGSIRRAMLLCFGEGCESEVSWAQRSVSGQELIEEDRQEPVAVLAQLLSLDGVLRHYILPAAIWATVTPMVLPGYDDPAHYRRRLKRGTTIGERKQLLQRLDNRIDGLVRKAIIQAGFSRTLAKHVDLEWRPVGFWPGVELASRYGVPNHLRRFPRLHVRLHWRDPQGVSIPVPGPVCLGGGRFFGLGLFAGMSSRDTGSSAVTPSGSGATTDAEARRAPAPLSPPPAASDTPPPVDWSFEDET